MTKQLNVKLGFQADVSQAKQQIQSLQQQLNNLMNSSVQSSGLNGFNTQITAAQQSVLKLQTVLGKSINMDTGRLDLSKFNQQLSGANLSINKIATDLSALGPEGNKAFLNLANSIVTAQRPMIESNKLLDNMWTALKNTARWQLSSSILHGFIGSLQGAYGYAQNLNKSLNSIRIVSGESADQMAEFAEQANRAAQSLSTSTLAYTDAALIFYQQGLRGEDVTERVDTVLKLSNITGESADSVSSYMTAIWNNFDDGSASLESYADKITALGAATASSSQEIANGMQQFAAVANTVGLSYDYAATALATVVAQTRQSESTVGNAFRTIFSRLESLKLGETLEDETDMTKYSQALASIGVNIKKSNGDLKNMDTILEEIGAKWQQLTKAQQVALAQTVGGVRQYANLIALFENWDKFQQNLLVSKNAEGTLTKQAEIYQEGWEAARKRVQAAWQAIYQDLLDDKFFIKLTDILAKILKTVDNIIDSMGGLKGLLPGIMALLLSWKPDVFANGLLRVRDVIYNIGNDSSIAAQKSREAVSEVMNEIEKLKLSDVRDTEGQNPIIDNLKTQVELNYELRDLRKKISEDDFQYYSNLIKLSEEYAKQESSASQASAKAQQRSIQAQKELSNKLLSSDNISDEDGEYVQKIFTEENADFEKQVQDLIDIQEGIERGERSVEEYNTALRKLGEEFVRDHESAKNLVAEIKELADARVQAEIARRVEDNKSAANKDFQSTLKDQLKYAKEGLSVEEARVKAIEDANAAKREEQGIKLNYNDIEKEVKEKNPKLSEYEIKTKAIEQYNEKLREQLDLENEKNEMALRSVQNNEEYLNKEQEKLENNIELQTEELFNTKEYINKQKDRLAQELKALELAKKRQAQISEAQEYWNDESKTQKRYAKIASETNGSPADKAAAVEAQRQKDFQNNEFLALGPNANYSAMLGQATKEINQRREVIKELKQDINEETIAEKEQERAVQQSAEAFEQNEQKLEENAKAQENLKHKIKETNEAYEEQKKSPPTKKSWFDDDKFTDNIVKGARAVSSITMGINSLNSAIKVWSDETMTFGEKLRNTLMSVGMALPMLTNGVKSLAVALGGAEKAGFITSLKTILTQVWAFFTTPWGIALAAIAVAIYAVVKSFNALSDAAKQAKKEAEEAKKAYEELKNSYDEIYSSIEDYKSSLEAIKELKAGTEEWTEAVEKLNNEVIELIDKYPELAEFLTSDNGILTFDEDKLDEFLKEYRDKIRESNLENIKASNASRKADLAVGRQQVYGALGGGKVSSYTPISGAEVNISPSIDSKAIDALTETYLKDSSVFGDIEKFKEALQSIGIANENIVNDLWENKESIEEYAKKYKTATNANKTALEAIDLNAIQVELGSEIDRYLSSANLTFITDEVIELYVEKLRTKIEKEGKDYNEALNELVKEFSETDISDQVDTIFRNKRTEAENKIKESDFSEFTDLIKELDNYQISLFLDQDLDQIEDFTEYIKDLQQQHDIDVNINLDDLTQTKIKKVAELREEVNTLSNYLKENVEEIDILDDHLKHCDKSLEKISYSVIRFDDAIQDVANNYDDWLTVLSSDSTLAKAKLAAEDLTKAYGNLFDIDGTQLNKAFLESTENLALLKEATEGSESAYNKLFETMAKEQLIANIEFSDDYTANKANALWDSLQKEMQPLQIGTELDTKTIIPQLNQLINATEMTAKEAQQFLHDAYNVDAVVTEHKINTVETVNSTEFIPEVTNTTTEVPGFGVINGYIYRGVSVPERIESQKSVLTVDTAQKGSGTDNFKFKQSSHGGGGLNPKKGSKSSSKRSTEKPKELTKKNEEEDRYHNIKEAIDDLSTALDRLSKNKDRAFGKQRLKYLNDEINKTKDQIKLTKQYINEIKEYQKIDRGKLESVLSSMGMSADDIASQFDSNGVLKDYEQLFKDLQTAFNEGAVANLNKIEEEYNKAAAAWNASDQGDAAKATFEAAKEKLSNAQDIYKNQEETFKKQIEALKQYEETTNLLQEKQQELIDQQNELYDKLVEAVKEKLEWKLELHENDRKLLEWVFKYIGDSADYAADKIANLSNQFDKTYKDIQDTEQAIQELFKNHGMKGVDFSSGNADDILKQLENYAKLNELPMILTKEEVETFEKYTQDLMSYYDKLEEKAKEIHQTMMDATSEWLERIDKEVKKIDITTDKMQFLLDVINLTGKKDLGFTDEEIASFRQQRVDNAQAKVEISAKKLAELQKEADKVREELAKATDEDSRKRFQEDLDKYTEMIENASAEWRDAYINALEEAKKATEENLEMMVQTAKDSFGKFGLDFAQEQFARIKELSELYLPDYKKYSELNKSTNQLKKSLQETNNALIRGKMNDLLDEINEKMDSGVQMSETEAGIIERRVALLQAEAQLRDAQNAKSAVRMTRDNEGNFSYTYTADQDAINSAAENYQEKFRELMEYEQNALMEHQERMMQLEAEHAEALQNLALLYDQDSEEFIEKQAEIESWYQERMAFEISQSNMLFGEQARLRNDDLADIERITGLKIAENDDFITSFNQTILSQVSGYETMEEYQQHWNDVSSTLLSQSTEYWNQWKQNNEDILAGFRQNALEEFGKVQEEVKETKKSAEDMVDKMGEKFGENIEKTSTWEQEVGSKMAEMRKHITDTVSTINDMIAKLGEIGNDINNTASSAEQAAARLQQAAAQAAYAKSIIDGANGSAGGSGGGIGDTLDDTIDGDDADTVIDDFWSYSAHLQAHYPSKVYAIAMVESQYKYDGPTTVYLFHWQTRKKSGTKCIGKERYVTHGATDGSTVNNSNTGSKVDWDTFASGGYTGDWGNSSGKLAILHSKELVLNKDDTENMLNAVQLVRQIVAPQLSFDLGKGINYNALANAGQSGIMEQQVHIDASFPNVQSHTEIEMALNNLINSATQYVNRKK